MKYRDLSSPVKGEFIINLQLALLYLFMVIYAFFHTVFTRAIDPVVYALLIQGFGSAISIMLMNLRMRVAIENSV